MHLLALPEDEQEIVRYLCEEEGLQLLMSDLVEDGAPQVAEDPLRALVPDLPSRKRLGAAAAPGVGVTDPTYREVWEYLLWARLLGPVRTLADAPVAQDAIGRVALRLNCDATERWRDLIDLTRTPVIGLRRTGWHHRENCLIAGGLTTMRVRDRDLPREAASLHSRVERYLKRHSQRLDPFETCHLYRGPRRDSTRLRGWWMWAMPHAQSWLAAGGQAFRSTSSYGNDLVTHPEAARPTPPDRRGQHPTTATRGQRHPARPAAPITGLGISPPTGPGWRGPQGTS